MSTIISKLEPYINDGKVRDVGAQSTDQDLYYKKTLKYRSFGNISIAIFFALSAAQFIIGIGEPTGNHLVYTPRILVLEEMRFTLKIQSTLLFVGLIFAILSFIYFQKQAGYFRFLQRLNSKGALQRLMEDDRNPIVYFRPFSLDEASMLSMFLSFKQLSKEQIIALNYIDEGPFIAIGKPGEIAPELGAARVYVDEDVWPEVAKIFIDEAGIIIFRLNRPRFSDNLKYEIEQCVKLNAKKKLHLIFFGREFDALKDVLCRLFNAITPDTRAYRRSVLCFKSDNVLFWSDKYRLQKKLQSGNKHMKEQIEEREYIDKLAEHYSLMSDDELLELKKNNLTEQAVQIYEQEIKRREL